MTFANEKDCACNCNETPAGQVTDPAVALEIADFARALADPVRVQMLALMARDSNCCTPDRATRLPEGVRRPAGVCVCEFQQLLGLAQSKASYHLRILRDAGIVRETAVGKWTFYSIDGKAALSLLARIREQFLLGQQ